MGNPKKSNVVYRIIWVCIIKSGTSQPMEFSLLSFLHRVFRRSPYLNAHPYELKKTVLESLSLRVLGP